MMVDSNAADDAGDLAGIWMQRRRFAEEGLEVLLSFDLLRERSRSVPRQPADDFVHLLPLAPFHFGFLDVVGINAGERSSEDSMLLHRFLWEGGQASLLVLSQAWRRRAPVCRTRLARRDQFSCI